MNARRLRLSGLVLLVALVGASVLASVTVFAAAPKEPQTKPATEVKDTTATLEGVLNPHGKETDGWFFAYSTGSGCTGAATTPLEPEAEVEAEAERTSITGLTPNTTYTYCLVARNSAGEVEVGNPMSFTTSIVPQAPETKPASEVKNTQATLEGVVNPTITAIDSWYFQYNAGASCVGGSTTPVEPTEEKEGTRVQASRSVEDQPVAASIAKLQQNTEYTFCLVTRNDAEELTVGSPVSFTTTAVAPVVSGVSFSTVGSAGVTLTARVDPEGADTTYHFEYDTTPYAGSTTHGTFLPSPNGDVGAGVSPVPVQATPQGLTPSGVYHFRLVATSVNGSTSSTDLTFSTLPQDILGLPDGRVYEMVTPVENSDAEVYVPNAGDGGGNEENGIPTDLPFQAASDGDAIAYVGGPSSVGGNGNAGDGGGNEYLAERSASGGWSQTNIQPLGSLHAGYQAFSSDLSVGIFDILSAPGTRSVSQERNDVLYQGEDESGTYRALSPPSPQPGRVLSSFEVLNDQNLSYVVDYAGSSEGMGHVLFEVNDALTPDAVDGGEEANNLYDSSGGVLHLVNVLPNGSTHANASFGGPAYKIVEDSGPDFSHVISSDGSRVFWTDQSTGDLYVRENDTQPESPIENGRCVVPGDACTVQVDASQGPGGGGGGRFWTASDDGSKVFFTDSDMAGLTNDTISGSGQNLYEYELTSGRLVDLTSSSNASVEGVISASEDGEYVYFVAAGSLKSRAIVGQPNLYLRHDGVTTFIATLKPSDGNEIRPWGGPTGNQENGDWQPNVGHRTAEVTPDGHSLVFMSSASLTGYDNQSTNHAQLPYVEVYVYEAEHDQLLCVSCSKGKEAPPANNPEAAAFVPVSHSNTYLPRWISEDGSRVFFDSYEPLVAQDVNGQLDVYEWERDGVEDCQENGGCVYMLSGGTSLSSSWLLDASVSGNDVFINTRAQLVPQDQNDNYDVYDARVDGFKALSPPACSGTGCQGVPSAPPIFATPASTTFAGVGNFVSSPKASVQPKKAKKPAKKPAKKRKRHKGKTVKGRGRSKPGRKSNIRGAK